VTHTDVVAGFTTLSEKDEDRFGRMAEAVFHFQREHNPVYRRVAEGARWTHWQDAPLLPIEAFKLVAVSSSSAPPARTFLSSGTGRGTQARHHVADIDVYERSVTHHFRRVFGTSRRTILAHLPGYSELGEASSLVHMARVLIDVFGDEQSGFVLEDERLLDAALSRERPILLLGAAFGLLDLLDERPRPLPEGSIVLETGGMKTYRKEISRAALHAELSTGFAVGRDHVLSEYGMCEFLSQCYTRGGEVYFAPPWMRVRVLDPLDPARELPEGEPGALAVVDLANVYSASFVLTQDQAVAREGGFEVLGRLSGAELRGCNFLLEADGSVD
jgi:hypothetical protein